MRRRRESARRRQDQIFGVGRQQRVVAGEADSGAAALEGEGVVEADGMQDGFQFVEAVGAFPKMLSRRLTLQNERLFQRH